MENLRLRTRRPVETAAKLTVKGYGAIGRLRFRRGFDCPAGSGVCCILDKYTSINVHGDDYGGVPWLTVTKAAARVPSLKEMVVVDRAVLQFVGTL